MRTSLVASLTALEELEHTPVELLSRVEVLEVRADLVANVDVDWLRQRFGGRLLLTLRSHVEGGRFRGAATERTRRLLELAPGFDLVDLEVDRDLDPKLLEAIAEERRVLSWHGTLAADGDFERRVQALSSTGARYRKLIPHSLRSGQDVAVMQWLRELSGQNWVCFCTGEVGTWTRLVAPYLGSALVFVSLGDQPAAPGQLSLRRVVEDFGLPELRPVRRCYGIAGSPVAHSLSPRVHNGAYRELGLPYLFLPFEVPHFGEFWLEVVEDDLWPEAELPLGGLAVTTPHKDAALAVAGAASPRAQRIEAANTLVFENDVWHASTTDPEGVSLPLIWRDISLMQAPALVLGAGGAGRAAALALSAAGARTVLSNRTAERGRHVADELGVSFCESSQLRPEDYGIVVNATSLGRQTEDDLPIDVKRLAAGTVVVDLVYASRPTALVAAARERGLEVIDGREVLLAQAVPQFRLLTGHDLPLAAAARALGVELPEKALAGGGA